MNNKIDRNSSIWLHALIGVATRYPYDNLPSKICDRVDEIYLEATRRESNDNDINNDLHDALEMVYNYLDQLIKDGYTLPNIDIVKGSNFEALNRSKKS